MSVRSVLGIFAVATMSVSAQAADLPSRIVIKEPIQKNDPCADLRVLRRIVDRFAWAEKNTWHRGFLMASIQNGRLGEHGYFEPGLIHREYCRADAVMTNARTHPVYYTIEFGQGFASIGNYVDFCVLDLDPWRIHDEACRTVR